jgi:hypothetical protein
MKIKMIIFGYLQFTIYCLFPILTACASCIEFKDSYVKVFGTQDTLNLRDFNVFGNGADETGAIQIALNKSVGKVLYIPRQEGIHYLTGQLIVPDNISIVCHPDVVFMAKDDLEQHISKFEVMWRFEESKDVTFDGQGALFKMDKTKYSNEHNHVFMINGSRNVVLKNARTEGSGGDGFYVGAYKTKSYPRDIRIENCSANNSRRQGLSVITVDGLKVINSMFNSTKGAAPQDGVDIEPNTAMDVLKNIKFSSCQAISNTRRGFEINLMKLKATSEPVDILFEDCVAIGNTEGFSSRRFIGVQGTIEFKNCTAKNSQYSGITESHCESTSIKKIYRNFIIENSNTSNAITGGYLTKAAIYIFHNIKTGGRIGNSEFINCKVINDNRSTYGLFLDHPDRPFENVSARSFQIENSSIATVNNLP